jgi:hypothetical protein
MSIVFREMIAKNCNPSQKKAKKDAEKEICTLIIYARVRVGLAFCINEGRGLHD